MARHEAGPQPWGRCVELVAAGRTDALPRGLRAGWRRRRIGVTKRRRLQFRDGCLRQHNDLGADLHAAIEVDHILVFETDAAARYLLADGARRVGAVDTILRAGDVHGAGAERIARPAGSHTRQVGLTGEHFSWRVPIG